MSAVSAVWTASGDTWALPGGARDSYEDAPVAALRETEEEAEIRPADVVVRAQVVTSRMPGTVWHRPGLELRHAAELLSRLRPDQRHDELPENPSGSARPRTSAPCAGTPRHSMACAARASSSAVRACA